MTLSIFSAVGVFGALLSGVLLGLLLARRMQIGDLVTTTYFVLASVLITLAAYGLLLFRWRSDAEWAIPSGTLIVSTLITFHFVTVVRKDPDRVESPREEGGKVRVSGPGAIVVLVPVLVFGLGYLLYQNEPYPRGFDGAWHYVRVESLFALGTLPSLELGTLTGPFYQRGYHMAIGALVFDPSHLETGMKLWNLFLISTYPLAAWTFAKLATGSRLIGAIASFASLFLAGQIILQGGYPMVMSFHFLAFGLTITVCSVKKRASPVRLLLALFPIYGMAFVAVHPVTAQIYLLFALGILLFVLIARSGKGALLASLGPFYALLSGTALYALVYPDLLSGQLLLFGVRLSAPESINFVLSSPPVRTAVVETLILFFSPFLVPVILIGVIEALRTHHLPVLAVSSVGATMAFMQVLPLNGREPYFLFLPISLLSAWGIETLFFRGHVASDRLRVTGTLLLGGFVLFSSLSVAHTGLNPKIGPESYLGAGETEFARLLVSNGLTGSRFLTLNNPAMVRIAVLSGNHAIVGDSRYFDLPEYREAYFLFMEEDCNAILEGTSAMQTSGVLLSTQWAFHEIVLGTFGECFATHRMLSSGGFVVLYWSG